MGDIEDELYGQTTRLSPQGLRRLPAGIDRPRYDREAVRAGIFHLGVGAFHRAHQAVYVDRCLAAGERGWGILGASLQSAASRDALAPQGCLYTLAVRDGAGESLSVIGALLGVHLAPENPSAVLDAMADPAIRIVTLTVTEKAYLRNAQGDLDAAHPAIAADLRTPGAPRTIFGFLAGALERRRAAGVPPFTILSCDNLPANGATLHRLLIQFADLRDSAMSAFIAQQVACPSSMVDCIVPATTVEDRDAISARLGVRDEAPVVTEPFMQWVIEDRFPAGRPDWERFGVTMVEDVAPFELMKLRLLNGAHSALAYLGQLLGFETVADCFAQPEARALAGAVWRESSDTLPRVPGLDPADYTRQLASRFSNPALRHRTAQIANDGSQKLPQRIIAPALERLEKGQEARALSFVVALWIKALASRKAGDFNDPLDAPLEALLSRSDSIEAIFDLTGFARASAARTALLHSVQQHCEAFTRTGLRAALSTACA